MVVEDSSPSVSRSNCEPTQSPWEFKFGSFALLADVGAPADTHLNSQVLRPGGNAGPESVFSLLYLDDFGMTIA